VLRRLEKGAKRWPKTFLAKGRLNNRSFLKMKSMKIPGPLFFFAASALAAYDDFVSTHIPQRLVERNFYLPGNAAAQITRRPRNHDDPYYGFGQECFNETRALYFDNPEILDVLETFGLNQATLFEDGCEVSLNSIACDIDCSIVDGYQEVLASCDAAGGQHFISDYFGVFCVGTIDGETSFTYDIAFSRFSGCYAAICDPENIEKALPDLLQVLQDSLVESSGFTCVAKQENPILPSAAPSAVSTTQKKEAKKNNVRRSAGGRSNKARRGSPRA
jgi:hypothetical protein